MDNLKSKGIQAREDSDGAFLLWKEDGDGNRVSDVHVATTPAEAIEAFRTLERVEVRR